MPSRQGCSCSDFVPATGSAGRAQSRSTQLQYALADRAFRLGWRRDQIIVIDDDLGRLGASAVDRPGFQRPVAEVELGDVGTVVGIEASRLARSCRGWHQLLKMCALFDTLIGDADGIYDPSTYNDRLLLSLKGTMSEAELHILKALCTKGAMPRSAAANSSWVCRAVTLCHRRSRIICDKQAIAAARHVIFGQRLTKSSRFNFDENVRK